MYRLVVAACALLSLVAAEAPVRLPGGDERFKADLLLVVAHADDDTIASPYLARAVLEEGKRVAVVHVTNTGSGFHAFGAERQRALGLIRQVEARQALGLFGISQVWFLEGDDTFSQNVLASLHSLGHGRTLEQVVRVMRLTRPEVVLTWLPANTIGQNHGGHQAAGVLATEAFDLAGDPTAFPAQLDLDGLRPWQPKKLYFASDAFSTEFMRGRGPAYSMYDVSPSRQKPYIELAAEETALYRSQYLDDEWKDAFASGDMKRILRVLTTGEWPYFVEPLRFALGKSLVGGEATGDLFEAVRPAPVNAVPSLTATTGAEPALSLGPPWSFYRAFYERHGLAHLHELVPPSATVKLGGAVPVSLLVRNEDDRPRVFEVKAVVPMPAGWSQEAGTVRHEVPAHATSSVRVRLQAPDRPSPAPVRVELEAVSEGRSVGRVTLRVAAARFTTDP